MRDEPNDPKWRRFAATHEAVSASPGTGVPTLGVGSFTCGGCGQDHIAIAVVLSAGEEASLCVPPELAEQAAMDILTRVAELKGTS